MSKEHLKNYVAEHSKTVGIDAGDAFIIRMHYTNQR